MFGEIPTQQAKKGGVFVELYPTNTPQDSSVQRCVLRKVCTCNRPAWKMFWDEHSDGCGHYRISLPKGAKAIGISLKCCLAKGRPTMVIARISPWTK